MYRVSFEIQLLGRFRKKSKELNVSGSRHQQTDKSLRFVNSCKDRKPIVPLKDKFEKTYSGRCYS